MILAACITLEKDKDNKSHKQTNKASHCAKMAQIQEKKHGHVPCLLVRHMRITSGGLVSNFDPNPNTSPLIAAPKLGASTTALSNTARVGTFLPLILNLLAKNRQLGLIERYYHCHCHRQWGKLTHKQKHNYQHNNQLEMSYASI